MKARIKKTGEIVDVNRNIHGLYVDENRVGYTLNELDFGNEENEHWQDVRERAAIAAMQEIIILLSSSDRTAPNEIAEFACACANALIEQLKSNQNSRA